MKFCFTKEERLCNQRIIDKVFDAGESFFVFPFRVLYIPIDQLAGYPAQVIFSVPKRNIKLAVSRNLIRRRMREAYRLHKHILLKQNSVSTQKLGVVILFTGKQIADYTVIEKGIVKALKKLAGLNLLV
jgi:ribonuclease P protein component